MLNHCHEKVDKLGASYLRDVIAVAIGKLTSFVRILSTLKQFDELEYLYGNSKDPLVLQRLQVQNYKKALLLQAPRSLINNSLISVEQAHSAAQISKQNFRGSSGNDSIDGNDL